MFENKMVWVVLYTTRKNCVTEYSANVVGPKKLAMGEDKT